MSKNEHNSSYKTVEYTDDNVLTHGLEAGWADDENPRNVNFNDRKSFLGPLIFDVSTGRPVNPVEKTGVTGRGKLGKWGPNQAADPVVIMFNEEGLDGKILLIKRKDSGDWALPGGMVDNGEVATRAAARELKEEAGIDLFDVAPVIVSREYVYDPRNTDNAWMETTVALFRIKGELSATAGDDAIDVNWVSIDELDDFNNRNGLYASHFNIIKKALKMINEV